MTVIGSVAWVGTLTRTGPQAGTEGWFRAIDNGEGASAPPDGVRLQAVRRPPGGAQAFCDAAPNAPGANPVGAGQVPVGMVSPTPPGALALWLKLFGPAIGVSTARELQLLFCGP